MRTTLTILLLLFSAMGFAQGKQKVVFQVSDNDPAKWTLALNNARNVQQDLGAQNVQIEIVAYGPGLSMLRSESKVADWMDNQRDDVVDFRDVAKGVKADIIIGIDLKAFNIHEPGGTLLKGRTTIEAKFCSGCGARFGRDRWLAGSECR